jgi:phosphoribosylanthranilate isomerase
MFVKICGLTDAAAVDAAVSAGADAVGFVFAESVREIAPDRARALCRDLPGSIIRVAVMRHPGVERFRAVIDAFDPDWIQTDAGDFAGLPSTGRATPLPVLREGDGAAAGTGAPSPTLPPRVLFEGRVSGSGVTADWDEARRIAASAELILAGGLDADNVIEAIEYVRPYGVDVSSGVESERGRKDPGKIREFLARVREWEKV